MSVHVLPPSSNRSADARGVDAFASRGPIAQAREAWSAAAEDPVVLQLSSALAAAERSADDFAVLYADALRLAVATRIESLREQAVPAPRGRGVPSGLVKWRLKRVTEFVDAELHRPVTLADMAAAAGLSRMHFAAQFRAATGLRAHEYLLRRRIERAQELLQQTREPLAQIALIVGFQTQAHFTTVFGRFVGDTPHQWRRAHRALATAAGRDEVYERGSRFDFGRAPLQPSVE